MSADNIGFVDEQQGKDALADVRSDSSSTNWALFTYESPKSTKIILVGKGEGGANELASNLQDDMVGYGLIRRQDKIDDSVTVKFAFVMFSGENVNRMQKARISVHTGSVKKFIGQYHVDIVTSDKSEISDDAIASKIRDASGSGSRVVDKATGFRDSRSGSFVESKGSNVKTSGNLEFPNPSELKDAIAEVRKGSTDWVIFTYEDGTNNVVFASKGTGGADELLANLNDAMVGYILIRKTEKIDVTEAIKFAFIRFVGDNVPRMLKARLGTHFGKITEFFSPYHVSLDVTHKSEISDEIIMKSISSASGTRVHVLEDTQKSTQPNTSIVTGQRAAPKAAPGKTVIPSVPKSQGESVIKFNNKDEITRAIKDVRDDNANWVVVGYENKKGNTLTLLGKGSGGVAEMIELLTNDISAYGLVRKVDKIDESLTVKFAFISWMGEQTDRMHKARLGTYSGAVKELFVPYHVDINTSSVSELTDDIILKLIQENSGSRSKVKS